MSRVHVTKSIVGTDGLIYHGKAVKRRKHLEGRIADFNATLSRNKSENVRGYKKPGRMSK